VRSASLSARRRRAAAREVAEAMAQLRALGLGNMPARARAANAERVAREAGMSAEEIAALAGAAPELVAYLRGEGPRPPGCPVVIG
jgi:hypothetical protein